MRIKKLLLLMTACYVILCVFVVQWILSQYNSEKHELHIQLAQQFETSQREVLDTLLEKKFIDPLLHDKKGFKIILNDSSENTWEVDSKVFVHKITSTDTSSNGPIKINVEEEIKSGVSDKDLMMHGVKLVIKEVSNGNGIEKILYSSADTSLLRNQLFHHLNEKGYNFNISLTHGDVGDTNGKGKFIFLKSTVFPDEFLLSVGDYRHFLIKQILPQSIFAIVLLLLTGFAFIISYRSLKNQIMLNNMKNDLIDNMSHELKTPLSTIRVVIDALQNKNFRKDEAKTDEYLSMASQEINRLELLTAKVLNTSLFEGGHIQLNKEDVDLYILVNNIVDALSVRMKNENATCTIENSNDSFIVNGDVLHIEGVILNIIDNSLKYSQPNPQINIYFHQTENNVFISIVDNGPGIPHEYIKKIFNKFFRVPSGNLHQIKGHGLGLSYVAMVMKLHGGSVKAENISPRGLTFQLQFPKKA